MDRWEFNLQIAETPRIEHVEWMPPCGLRIESGMDSHGSAAHGLPGM